MDKKGVSIMVGYVLLIVMAIGMSGLVYSFLKFYVPSEKKTCPNDVMLSIEKIECVGDSLNITLQNRGLFSIDGSYIKIGDQNRIAKETFCFDPTGTGGSISPTFDPKTCEIRFIGQKTIEGYTVDKDGLKPGIGIMKNLDYNKKGPKEIEIQPVIVSEENEWIVCSEAILKREIECL